MKNRLIAATLFISMSAVVGASAAENRPGPYWTSFIGLNVPQDTGVTSYDYNTNNTFNDRLSFDPGIYIGGAGGYDFGMVRLEGEVSYKHAEIKSIAEQPSGYQFRNPDGNMGAFAVMFNAFLDFHNESRITPYLGGGIGFASLYMSNTYGTDTRGGASIRYLLYPEGSDTVFAYQAGFGADIAINRRFSLDVGYRYFNTDTANIGKSWLNASGMRYESHNVAVGFRVKY